MEDLKTTVVKTTTKYSDTEVLITTVTTSFEVVSLDSQIKKLEERQNLIDEVLSQKAEIEQGIEESRSIGVKTQEELAEALKTSEVPAVE